MPAGSQYPGPADALELYKSVVDGNPEVEVKGAKSAYTSRNGHMFSFLDPDGVMALRLSNEMREVFLETYDSGPVVQYGKVMNGYVSIPSALLEDIPGLQEWFDKSYEWIGTLKPNPTTRPKNG